MYSPPPGPPEARPGPGYAAPVTANGYRFRPLDLADVLDETFRIYRARFPVFAGISLAAAVPQVLVVFLTGGLGAYSSFFSAFQGGGPAASGPPAQSALYNPFNPWLWGGLGVVYLLLLALTPFSHAAVIQGTADHVMGNRVTLGSVLSAVLRRYLAVLAYLFIFGVFSLTICLLPLWIWIAVRWSMGLPAMFAEGIGPIRALERSWQLVENRWWRTFGILALVYLLQTVVAYVVQGIFFSLSLLVFLLPAIVVSTVVAAGSTLATALVSPIFLIALTLIYFDLRVRREGLDLQLLAQNSVPSPVPGAI
jgi:hypothetical protein